MIYRPYGKTGKKISALAAGGMRYADPARTEEMAKIALTAAQLGVNYFDTAPIYCDDRSEEILGIALKEMRREKLPYYTSSKSSASDGANLRAHLERSLKRLDIEKITFYHCWCITSMEEFYTREKGGAVAAILKAKEEGLIEHAVVSTHMSGPEIRQLVDTGYFEGITLGFCAINFPYRLEGMQYAAEKGMGVVAMNPLGGGQIVEHAERFDFIKSRPDESIVDAALHFVLAHEQISAALVGFTKIEDVLSAVSAVNTFEPISEPEVARIRLNIEKSFNSLCTTCNYCDDCPRNIPVAKFMEAYNQFTLYKDPQKVIDRLRCHWDIESAAILSACMGCGVCETKCTQHLPILTRFDEIKGFFEEEVRGTPVEG